MPNKPVWYGGSAESWDGTAKDSPGIHAWKKTYRPFWPIPKMEHYIAPIPDWMKDYYVPWPWWRQVLPVGAFTGLWPSARGNDWSKIKPEGFDANWRPTGPARPEAWE